MTANLQPKLFTFKQAAMIMNVSERMVYLAAKLMRSGRADLIAAVERGELSMHAALKQLEPPRRADTLGPLVRAWNAATLEEREALVAALDGDFGTNLQICSPGAERSNGGRT